MEIIEPLTPDEFRTRLKYDYQVVMQMRSPVMSVSAFSNPDDAEQRRNPIVSEDEGHLAAFYVVDYHIKTLVGRDRYSTKTSVLIDLQAENNYPFTEPSCYVFDSETPWSPHFWEGHPICLGDMWLEAQGNMLLGQLLEHIAKLLNFDELEHSPGYKGWNEEAIDYWRKVMHGRPIMEGLPYPKLPLFVFDSNLTRPEPEPTPVFSLKKTANPVSADAGVVFRRKGEWSAPPAPSVFKLKSIPHREQE